jgi:hypothetical protein
MALASLIAAPAFGSGGPDPSPVYIDRHGGTPAELARLFAGRLSVVTAQSPDSLLYLDWRLLHGLEVGAEAGAALTTPCCDADSKFEPGRGVYGWFEVRKLVPGMPESEYFIATDRHGPDYMAMPNCFADAFDSASETLRARAARYGASSLWVRAWLLAQDAVFDACADDAAALPAAPADPPAWLKADRAYQEAAFALYDQRNDEAATRFARIAADSTSPWQPRGLYLRARALHRQALTLLSPEAFAKAHAAIAAVAAAPAGTYGRGEVRKMLAALDYRERPEQLLVELDRELNRREPVADIAIRLRDYLTLGARAEAKPEAADWIQTLQATDRLPALDHARARWTATRDVAWLLAALSLASPGEAAAEPLVADAAALAPDRPGWGTAQYHLARLTLATADAAMLRGRLDAILARRTLTLSERNLFSAVRAQVATNLADLARFSLRQPFCSAHNGYCVDDEYALLDGRLGRRPADGAWVGFGADARAIVDRLPLADRIAFSRSAPLPRELRLDVALTSFARAVKLQDDGAIDGLARDLARLLPQMRREWRTIAASRPGPAKRFAEYFAMAKIPGLRADLIDYTRPRGTLRQFEGYWVDWMMPPAGPSRAAAEFPPANAYRWDWYPMEAQEADLTCLGHCGAGAFPLHLPAFVEAGQARAAAERAAFGHDRVDYDQRPGVQPTGAGSLWEEMLAYASVHPRDSRSPEALYWLIHIARWGANHDHIGKRAFQLLHARYKGSAWADRSPFYYDD